MPGFDLYLAQRAWTDLEALGERERQQFEEAKEIPLEDPTEANPLVASASGHSRFQPGDYMLVWGDVAVIYCFVTERVIQITGSGRRRRS